MPVDTSWTGVLLALGATLLAVVVVMAATAFAAHRQGRIAVVDLAWGLGFVVVAVVAAALGATAQGVLLVVLVAVWGLRLAWHLGRGSHGGEDPRYAAMLDTPVAAGGLGEAARKVLLVQGLGMWLVALPVTLGAVTGTPWWWAAGLGVVVWLVGLVFEVLGDAQLAAYKQRPRDERPPVLQTGLWGLTRHPNYFGDACVWWGLWLAGGLASGWLVGLVTVIAPLAMTVLLRNVTGAALLERTMAGREGWAEYAARVPMFVPRPPRPARTPRSRR